MSSSKFRRSSTKRVLIKHINEGIYYSRFNSLYTIFGQIKRIKIIAKIVGQREFFGDIQNHGKNYLLDDGTGEIRALTYTNNAILKKGDNVNVIGIIKKMDDKKYINVEIIKKIEDPELHKRYHQLLITLKIKRNGVIDLSETKKLLNTML